MGEFFKKIAMYAFGSAIAKLFIGVGVAGVTYQGLTTAVPPLLNGFVASLNGVSSEALNIILLAGLGEALTIIGSAAIARATMTAATTALGITNA